MIKTRGFEFISDEQVRKDFNLEKDFKIDTRGYRLKEVDQFLDIIIGDYEQFLEIINNLEKEKADLLGEIMNLKQELRNSQLSTEVATSRGTGEVTNVDILKRLSQSLQYIIDGNILGRKNYILKAFTDWSTNLYEKMEWV